MESLYKYYFQGGEIFSRARIAISQESENRIHGYLHIKVDKDNPDGVPYCNSFVYRSQINKFFRRKDEKGFNIFFYAKNFKEAEKKAGKLWKEYLESNYVVESLGRGMIQVSKGSRSILISSIPHRALKPENGIGKSCWRVEFNDSIVDLPSRDMAIDRAKELLKTA